jgi:probable rRNA maturation factor
LNIRIYYDQIKFRIRKTAEIKEFLEKVITDERKSPGDLVFILTNNENIIDINRKFLEHDYYTDVIAFDYSTENVINGEIYISIDTVKINAKLYKIKLSEELLRVMIHGLLHLCGYRDNSKRERDLMFKRQEKQLKKFGKESE